MKTLFTVVLLLALTGCATGTSRIARYSEGAYQVLHAADYSQTLRVGGNPRCYSESDSLAQKLIGKHPSKTEVTAYFAVTGLVHYGISRWLDNRVADSDNAGWRWARNGWHVLSIFDTARTVRNNDKIGLAPFGRGIASDCP